MTAAWLTEDDGTVWPCEVIAPCLWPGTVRVLDHQGNTRVVPKARLQMVEVKS